MNIVGIVDERNYFDEKFARNKLLQNPSKSMFFFFISSFQLMEMLIASTKMRQNLHQNHQFVRF